LLDFILVAGGDAFASVSTYRRSARRSQTMTDLWLRLDTWPEPGLSRAEVRKLLATCRCGMVMTRRVFKYHTCAQKLVQPPIIDLTSSTDAEVIDLTVDSVQ
jgi:hypothetical protein